MTSRAKNAPGYSRIHRSRSQVASALSMLLSVFQHQGLGATDPAVPEAADVAGAAADSGQAGGNRG
jgi:hypothetical protein